MTLISEDLVEEEALGWFYELDYGKINATPSEYILRPSSKDVYFKTILTGDLKRINPTLPSEAIQNAKFKILNLRGHSIVSKNREFHQMAIEGVSVEYQGDDGKPRYDRVKIFDFDNLDNNSWSVANQFLVSEGKHKRRPDIVIFVNGLPLAVIELKSPSDRSATLKTAWNQLQTYKNQIPSLFVYNLALVISDGTQATIGSLTAGIEWFKFWRTIDGETFASNTDQKLEVLIKGVFEKGRLLDLMQNFTVFEDDGIEVSKKLAGYHQFHAVRAAISETLRATQKIQSDTHTVTGRPVNYGGALGDKRVGVVWHTQGSGKSLTMVFYTGMIIRHPDMENPTVVVLTDRNDLDDQLFTTFSRCKGLLRQTPVQAESRIDLREKLSVKAGGIVFTTIQKFFPDHQGHDHALLSERHNIVVIADEAHRSQYDFIDGYARHMRDALPNASFIGFTGTPIERADTNTRLVFGDHISIYDIQRSVDDKATVPIYYDCRLAELSLDESEQPKLDPKFEEITENQESGEREKTKSKWSKLEAVAGSPQRIKMIAEDISSHFQQRLEVLHGKAMIVCMSREICIDLYQELVRLNPQWHSEDDHSGAIKVVMIGSASDPNDWQPHIRSKSRREMLAKRFRDPDDPFNIVLVRDMWLTGFDAPSLHTMYIDKPMRGHGLMQSIARVNRVFKDKPGGLIVDYLGLANHLQLALASYTENGGQGKSTLNKNEAVEAMLIKYEICVTIFHGFDRSVNSSKELLDILPAAMQHILAQKNGKERFIKAVRGLKKAFTLAVPHEEADRIKDDVAFFQTVATALSKRAPDELHADEKINRAMRQIVSQVVVSDGVIDIFSSAGLKKPEISILSEDFLKQVHALPQPDLAVEVLRKLLKGEILNRRRKNIIQAKLFSEMLQDTVNRYQNDAFDTLLIIEQLINLANEMRDANARGEALNLSDDELAFYDALGDNDSAIKVLGNEKLSEIARKLTQTIREKVKIDWIYREDVQAEIRSLIRRDLRKFGYPPDKREKAVKTVIKQAEVLSADWANAQ